MITEKPDARAFVGKTEEQARALAKEYDLVVRVRSRDGQTFIGTCDFRTDRINLHVKGGFVTDAAYN